MRPPFFFKFLSKEKEEVTAELWFKPATYRSLVQCLNHSVFQERERWRWNAVCMHVFVIVCTPHDWFPQVCCDGILQADWDDWTEQGSVSPGLLHSARGARTCPQVGEYVALIHEISSVETSMASIDISKARMFLIGGIFKMYFLMKF